MDIFGIGALEILFILVIALLVLGPEELVKTGKVLGKFLRRLATSDSWRTIQDASKEMRNLPNRLMREAGIDEIEDNMKNLKIEDPTKAIKDEMKEINKGITAWTTTPATKESTESSDQPDDIKPTLSSQSESGETPETNQETVIEKSEQPDNEVQENRIAPELHEESPEIINETSIEESDR